MAASSSTGKLTNSQIKVKSFFFDCADPIVNLTDGTYNTDLVLPNHSMVLASGIKYKQDLSAYPAITIGINVVNAPPNQLNSDTLPIVNMVDGYAIGNVVPGLAVAAAPGFAVWVVHNTNNAADGTVIVRLNGITGSGVTQLSFMVWIQYIEFDF